MIFLIICTITSQVVSATFYPDQILIREEVKVHLTGSKKVTITGLPGNLDPTSFRISGRNLSIGEVSLVEVYLKEPKDPKVRRLVAKIDSLEEEIRRIEDGIDALRAKEEFLKSIRVSVPKKISGELYRGGVDPENWRKVMDFIFEGAVDIRAEIREMERDGEKKKEALADLRDKLSRIAPYYRRRSYNAVIEVRAKRPGEFRLQLEYLIRSGGWHPYYELRPKGEGLEIGVFGKVIQRSGRDWKGAKVELTTARPSIGPKPPPLIAWQLRFEEVWAKEKVGRVLAQRPAVPARDEEQKVMIEEVGRAVSFKIPGLQTIKTGEEKKLPIITRTFPARMIHFTSPRVSPFVYLKAEAENGFDFPLLPGGGNVYSDGLFSGVIEIGHTAPGESLHLFIGPDEQIKVKRELVRRFKEKRGIFKKREAVSYHFRITVNNYRKRKIDLILKDQIPISTDAEIKVRDVQIDPKTEPDEKGILTWPITLNPNEEREFNIKFTVEYPKGRRVIGLP